MRKFLLSVFILLAVVMMTSGQRREWPGPRIRRTWLVDDTGLSDVKGPAASTDDAVARWDGTTGRLLQDSIVLIDDAGNITGFSLEDDSVMAADINDVDSPADEDILTYESGAGGDFEWHTIVEMLSLTNTDSLSEGAANLYSTLANIQTATTNDFHNIGGTDDDVPDAGDFAAGADLDLNGEVADDSHGHTTTTISGLDISADTNLTAGDHITLTDDDLDVDDDFIKLVGDTTGPMTEDLNLDDGTLVISYDENRVGIGTTGPSQELHVVGSGEVARFSDTSLGATVQLTIEGNATNGISMLALGDTFNIDVGKVQYNHSNNFLSLWTAAGERVTVNSVGKVGIGVTTPARELHVSGPTTWFRLDRNDNSYGPATLLVRQDAAGSAVQSSWLFGPTNTGGSSGDDFAIIDFGTETSGTGGDARFLIDKATGSVSIGTTDFGVGGAGVLSIGAGTHQTTMGTDCASLFVEDVVAGTAELRCMDEAENETTLSSHNFTLFKPNKSYTYPWSYYAQNDIIGEEINVDMYGAIEAIEDLSGRKFIYTRKIAKDPNTWEEKQSFLQKKKMLQEEVEISLAEAIEEYEITEPNIVGHKYKIEYEFDPNTGTIIEIETEVPIIQRLSTGKFAKRLKAGMRLDKKTGKLYRKKQLDEIEINSKDFKELPKWLKDRL